MHTIGMGYDIHRIGTGRKLVLGGVDVPFFKGLWGHSDADVLVHAVIDAVLGAFALGDIGRHFPDSDPAYEGISSLELLSRVEAKVAQLGKIDHIDSTIVAERPKLAEYVDLMRANLAGALKLPVEKISIKAKTSEGLGPVGEGLAIEAYAVALVER